ncbi:MAG: hypothetical protein WA101_00365 [Minisyncoccia bacterium]
MVQLIKNFLSEKRKKRLIVTQISDKFESEEIFNLFLKMKTNNTEKNTDKPVLKVFEIKKEIIFPKINEIRNKNISNKKLAIQKTFELLEEEFKCFKEAYKEFSASKPHYFSLHGENKTVYFLISEKDNDLLKSFAFTSFCVDFFVHAKREHRQKVSDCTISAKDKKLLKNLGLLAKLDHQWEFEDNQIKSTPFKITNITWEKIKEIFLLPVAV